MRHPHIVLVLTLLAGACVSTPQADRIPRSGPQAAEYLLNQGVAALNRGQLDLAEQKLQQAVQRNPMLLHARNALGLVYTYKRNFPKAIETFEKLLQLSPEYYDAYNTLGAIYIELNQFDRAKEKLLVAANAKDYLTPENAFANLAILELRNNRLDAASRYIGMGLNLNNKYALLYNLKGTVEENQNKLKEAAESYTRALSLQPDPDVNTLLNCGRVYARIGEKKQALDVLEKALGKVRDNAVKQEIERLIKSLDERKD